MADTQELIARLSGEAKLSGRLSKPSSFARATILALAAYAVASTFYLEIRPDLMMQFSRPLFLLECLLLLGLTVSSVMAAIYSMYPDNYQQSVWLKLPYLLFAALVLFIAFQMPMPTDARMVIPTGPDVHEMECALCIAILSILPSAIIFTLLKRGATAHPFQSGAFAVLASSGLGSLALRLAEANDSVMHLAIWHYLPTFLFSVIGALIGKWLLKW